MSVKELINQPAVELRADWQAFLDATPDNYYGQTKRRPFTAEEDRFILEARRRGRFWREIAEKLDCSESTAMKRFRELDGGNHGVR